VEVTMKTRAAYWAVDGRLSGGCRNSCLSLSYVRS